MIPASSVIVSLTRKSAMVVLRFPALRRNGSNSATSWWISDNYHAGVVPVATHTLTGAGVPARYFSSTSATAVNDTSDSTAIQLYQYAICPFCNRVKALLDYSGLPYKTVEVNPLTKAEIKWSKDYRKVPIAMIDGEVVCGSDVIMSNLLQRSDMIALLTERWEGPSNTVSNTPSRMDMTTFTNSNAQEWTKYSVDELASLLYPNMCRNLSDSYQAFSYVDTVPAFGGRLNRMAIKGIGSVAMYMAAGRIKKKRSITDERAALEQCLIEVESNGLENGQRKFVSGMEVPNLGDVSLFGTIRAIQGLPAHDEIIEKRGGILEQWYERMRVAVERKSD